MAEWARVAWIRRDDLVSGEFRYGEWIDRSIAEATARAMDIEYPEVAHFIDLPPEARRALLPSEGAERG